MRRGQIVSAVLVVVVAAACCEARPSSFLGRLFYGSENLLAVSAGPSWPRYIRETAPSGDRTAFEANLEYGRVWERVVSIGIDLDLMLRWTRVDTVFTDQYDNEVRRLLDERKWVMVPFSFYFKFDPLYRAGLHPLLTLSAGMSTLRYYNREWDAQDSRYIRPGDGYYVGLIVKGSGDILYDFGDYMSVFVGLKVQWCEMLRNVDGSRYENRDYRQTMHGPQLRTGVRLVF